MEKRYQVFISSTFADLEEERKGVMEAIISLNCFPAGMEMFPASNKEQFQYIQSVIDESDYYIIIVAGKYGSIAEDGISYTEKEFDYARGKGIPILAFVKKDIESLPAGKVERDNAKIKKIDKFREKVMDGRLVQFWDNGNELKYKLHSSLSHEMKTNPRVGWIRGNTSADLELYNIIDRLRQENLQLQKDNEKLIQQNMETNDEENDKFKKEFENKLKSEFSVVICSDILCSHTGDENIFGIKEISIYDVLEKIGFEMLRTFSKDEFEKRLCKWLRIEHITTQSVEEIIMKLLALKLINLEAIIGSDKICMTDLGKEIILSTVEF